MNNPIRYREEHCVLFWLWLDWKEKNVKQMGDTNLIRPKYEDPVGAYIIGAYAFPLAKRPSWIQRFLMRHLLGFTWKDYQTQ